MKNYKPPVKDLQIILVNEPPKSPVKNPSNVSMKDPSTLPIELFRYILQKLPINSLKSALLVNRTWRDVGEDPELWIHFKLVIWENELKMLGRVLALPRLSRLHCCYIQGFSRHLDDYVSAVRGTEVEILSKSQIQKLVFKNVWISLFPSGNYLLMSLGSQLTELTFDNVVICKKSIYCLFLGLARDTERRLKKLVIRYTGNGSRNLVECADMSEVPRELLAKVTERLDILRFRQIRISTDQLIEVLVAARSSEEPLKDIELSLIDLSQVPPDVLTPALLRVQKVSLYTSHLTTTQLYDLLMGVLQEEANISNLHIGGNTLNEVIHLFPKLALVLDKFYYED